MEAGFCRARLKYFGMFWKTSTLKPISSLLSWNSDLPFADEMVLGKALTEAKEFPWMKLNPQSRKLRFNIIGPILWPHESLHFYSVCEMYFITFSLIFIILTVKSGNGFNYPLLEWIGHFGNLIAHLLKAEWVEETLNLLQLSRRDLCRHHYEDPIRPKRPFLLVLG